MRPKRRVALLTQQTNGAAVSRKSTIDRAGPGIAKYPFFTDERPNGFVLSRFGPFADQNCPSVGKVGPVGD
jgi:hypothetical protein